MDVRERKRITLRLRSRKSERKQVTSCFRSNGHSPVPSSGSIEGPQPFDFHSAGGDMCVAEERSEAATKEAMIK